MQHATSSVQPASTPSAVPSATPAIRQVTPAPTASPTAFTFDVENRSRVAVVVSVASDAAGAMQGFLPGQRGTVSIMLRNPQNGVGVEVQGAECRLLASGSFPTPVPFTLLIEDGAGAMQIQLSLVAGASTTPLPLPTNSLHGCSG